MELVLHPTFSMGPGTPTQVGRPSQTPQPSLSFVVFYYHFVLISILVHEKLFSNYKQYGVFCFFFFLGEYECG